LNSSLCIAAISGLLDGEYCSQKTGTKPRQVQFARKLAAVAAHADLVIYATNDARHRSEPHLRQAGRVPPGVVSPLGVPMPVAQPLPEGLRPTAPYFIVLGTIEPRKNHALLLDVWEELGPEPPTLFICGSRGWLNTDVFARLDAKPPGIVELSGLSDGAIAALLSGARALLFPSIAEGFGIPMAEAAALGSQVLCGDLAICREVLGDAGVYLPLNNHYVWKDQVLSAVSQAPVARIRFVPPDWDTHFKTALDMT
jgi:glycosyltransferase involved in cell wall biosynthesis